MDVTEVWPCSWDVGALETAPRTGVVRSRRNHRKRIARNRSNAAASLPPSAVADHRFAFFIRTFRRSYVKSAHTRGSITRSTFRDASCSRRLPAQFLRCLAAHLRSYSSLARSVRHFSADILTFFQYFSNATTTTNQLKGTSSFKFSSAWIIKRRRRFLAKLTLIFTRKEIRLYTCYAKSRDSR